MDATAHAEALIEEGLIDLSQAAKLYRSGKGVSPSTVWRHAIHGVRGVKLEAISAGGRLCTSRKAVLRFFAALTPQDKAEKKRPLTSAQVQARAERAIRALAKEGI